MGKYILLLNVWHKKVICIILVFFSLRPSALNFTNAIANIHKCFSVHYFGLCHLCIPEIVQRNFVKCVVGGGGGGGARPCLVHIWSICGISSALQQLWFWLSNWYIELTVYPQLGPLDMERAKGHGVRTYEQKTTKSITFSQINSQQGVNHIELLTLLFGFYL